MEKTILQNIHKLCYGKGDLLYLVKFGSHLYGTDTTSSDNDYKGIYLPSINNMLLEKQNRIIKYNSNLENKKNSSTDIDIELWSIQYWFSLLKKGTIPSIDMLFSHTNKKAIIYKSSIVDDVKLFAIPTSLIDIKNTQEYLSYALQQTKKYGIQGSRIDLLKSIIIFLKEKITSKNISTSEKFEQVIHLINQKFHHEKLCFIKKDKTGQSVLFILGNGFHEKIKIDEALQRLEDKFQKEGEKSRLAEKNIGIDWKAVSHAMRALLQIEELISSKNLVFPLSYSTLLKEVKSGKISWKECEINILEAISKVENLLKNYPENLKIDKFHSDIIIKCYQ